MSKSPILLPTGLPSMAPVAPGPQELLNMVNWLHMELMRGLGEMQKIAKAQGQDLLRCIANIAALNEAVVCKGICTEKELRQYNTNAIRELAKVLEVEFEEASEDSSPQSSEEVP